MDRELIARVANAVLRHFNITVPIHNIEEVVHTLGGTIQRDDTLPPYVGGQLEKSNDSFIIKVPSSTRQPRLQFTVAHELGHLFLHMGYRIDNERWEKSDGSVYTRCGISETEYAANEFAANFLMPRAEFEYILTKYQKGQIYDIEATAQYFHVSVDAVINRGKWLGLIAW